MELEKDIPSPITDQYKEKEEINNLFWRTLCIMAALRSENGCPWDKEQTHQSLKKYAIEEVYELNHAIDQGEESKIIEELGDVLLQVIFHSEIARQERRYSIKEVLKKLNAKLISRHPHVFGSENLATAQEVLENWEQTKVQERGGKASILDGIPGELPALMKAHRLQERVARVGFDWEKIEDVFAKVYEEISEFEAAYLAQEKDKIEEELGDLFFAVVNVARYLDTDAELALHRTIEKFEQRFRYVEEQVRKSGQELGQASLKDMDNYWEEAKHKFKQKNK